MAYLNVKYSIQYIKRFFSSPLKKFQSKSRTELLNFFTPLEEAVLEIKRRRQNPELMKAVQNFLNNDIPEHFNGRDPIFYLSRHVATPNYETLRFIELTRPFGLPIVIGQDPKDKFVSNNILKRCLGKMPVTKGISHTGDEIVEFFTIVDFSTAQGKKINEVKTTWGEPILSFHNALLQEIYPHEVLLRDESAWVDRNHRNDIYQNYTKLLALLLVHGIMLEFYEPEDDFFVEVYLKPALKEIEKKFGFKPLIVNLVDSSIELEKNWNGYPSVVYQQVKRRLVQ